MIIDMKKGDIFESEATYIAFAINSEGFNDSGFAGVVAAKFWPELADETGPSRMGSVFKQIVNGKVFYAVVCHALSKGWDQTPEVLLQALDSIDLDEGAVLNCVLMGGGVVGRMQGADTYAIMGAMARSKHSIVVYSR